MPIAARDRLVAAADRLFYAEGIRAVGVERLLAESGVGRASFYRHFPGKDDLVVTVLSARLARWRADLIAEVDARGGGVLAVFDVLAEQAADPGYRGCAAINAMVEAADRGSAVHRVAATHKDELTTYLTTMLEDEERAGDLMLLVDGALVTSLRDGSALPRARAAAARLLRIAPSGPAPSGTLVGT